MVAKVIALDGAEGCFKSTQVKLLVEYLRSKGHSVLETKEPGTSHSKLTMLLRGVMLDLQYAEEITKPARELISQAIRSIHMERVVNPSRELYDYIVMDRCLLSGFAYGQECGNTAEEIESLVKFIGIEDTKTIYDKVIYLKVDPVKGLARARGAKQEFEAGDAMEALGDTFITKVSKALDQYSTRFNTSVVDVEGKTKEEILKEITDILGV